MIDTMPLKSVCLFLLAFLSSPLSTRFLECALRLVTVRSEEPVFVIGL